MRWLATVTAVWLCGLPSALAQSQDWLVLPTTSTEETRWMQPTVDALTRELRRQGVGVWGAEAAVAAFETRGSAPPAEVSDQQVRTWAARSQQALRRLARAETEAALAELEEAQAFARATLETLNREPERARTVLDTCLYLVRARLAIGDDRGAATQIEECVRMVPSGEPSDRMHPPEVLALHRLAREPRPGRAGTLRVESEPPRCPLRLNGVRVGKTPIELSELPAGSYRVQLECEPGRGGRIHTVEVPPRGTSLFILDDFDRAVRSEPVLHLKYDDPPDRRQHGADARQFGRALPAPAVLVAFTRGEDVLELRVVSTTQVETTLVRIPTTPVGPPPSAVPKAVTALLAGQCTDFGGEDPVRIDCVTGEPLQVGAVVEVSAAPKSRPSARPPRGQFVSGMTLMSLGTASVLAGYGLFIARRPAGDDWLDSPNSLDAQDKWLGLGTGLLATGAAGAGLLVAGMPLALPNQRKAPWWAWLSGGLGLAATAGAIASVATADPKPAQSCSINGPDPAPCVLRDRDTDRSFILGMTAAPLLTMPLVYLLRRDNKKIRADLAPVLSAGRGGGSIGLSGSF